MLSILQIRNYHSFIFSKRFCHTWSCCMSFYIPNTVGPTTQDSDQILPAENKTRLTPTLLSPSFLLGFLGLYPFLSSLFKLLTCNELWSASGYFPWRADKSVLIHSMLEQSSTVDMLFCKGIMFSIQLTLNLIWQTIWEIPQIGTFFSYGCIFFSRGALKQRVAVNLTWLNSVFTCIITLWLSPQSHKHTSFWNKHFSQQLIPISLENSQNPHRTMSLFLSISPVVIWWILLLSWLHFKSDTFFK